MLMLRVLEERERDEMQLNVTPVQQGLLRHALLCHILLSTLGHWPIRLHCFWSLYAV